MDLARYDDGVKYRWDGEEYATEEQARDKRAEYERDGFSVLAVAEDGKRFLYTRRLAAQAQTQAATA